MWSSTLRRSSYINWVLFKNGETGIYQSDELPEDKIEWFRIRPHMFTMIAVGVTPEAEEKIKEIATTLIDAGATPDPDSLDLQEPSLEPLPSFPKPPKPRKRPVLKD